MSDATAPTTDPGQPCLIIGAGPAGLTAAWELSQRKHPVIVFEKDKIVGGISRTEQYKGYRYDIGGHRFFSKSRIVRDWWERMLGDEFLTRPRLSHIYYNGVFFDYPLKPANALRGLGLIEAARCGFSYLGAQLFPSKTEATFEQWVSNRFGRRLFETFFKTYTEKVWGMKCSEISADWAAQRIKNLNLFTAVRNALVGNLFQRSIVTSLIEEFQYPRLGPGQMWERVASRLEESGQSVSMKADVRRIHHDAKRVTGLTIVNSDGVERRVDGAHVLSSMPIRELIGALDPAPPEEVTQAAERLRYRDFLTVGLIIKSKDTFPDNWIYVHSPSVQVGRIQNFKAWSPEMVPDDTTSSVGLEYFTNEGSELWTSKDSDLIELGRQEMAKLGLAKAEEIVDGCVIRMPKAYPVYDDHYKEAVATIRNYLESLPNLQLIGRNGQHRYNNQDHSMLTAIFAAENIVNGSKHDIWSINEEQSYHEEGAEDETHGKRGGDRLVPARADALGAMLEEAFARYDAIAMGAAVGFLVGVGLFLATAVLLLAGGENVGANLALLGNYFVGFEVNWPGAFIGLAEGGLLGFLIGFLTAKLINRVVAFHERRLLRVIEMRTALQAANIE